MATLKKAVFASLAGAALLAGCATGPYYDNGYGYGGYNYGYDGRPYYDSPAYVGPTVGFGVGIGYSEHDGHWGHHGWRDHDGRWHHGD